MTEPQPFAKKSDLGVRTASAVVMVAVAGTALWLGGAVWTVFVAAVALGVLWEWVRLSRCIATGPVRLFAWLVAGLAYVGTAAFELVTLRNEVFHLLMAWIVLGVIATDIGAYLTGRTFGGPKIAPKISPSKTWSGLAGGILGASIVILIVRSVANTGAIFNFEPGTIRNDLHSALFDGTVLAVIAQSGDFFESWMKRKAGVKDSGHLIPGHGGLFDRVDGLLAVCFAIGVMVGIAKL